MVSEHLAAGTRHQRRSPSATKTPKVDFNREVRPILAKNCFACHGQDEAKRAKGLRLDRREAAVKPLKSGETAIVPGDPDSSELILRITEEDETLRMPPKKHGNRLTPAEVDVLKRWIGEGAEYAAHWALIAPKALPLPDVTRQGLAPQRHRLLDPVSPRNRGTEAVARSRPLYLAQARQPGSPRFAADARMKSTSSSKTRPPTLTRRPSTGFSTTRLTANDGRGCGSTRLVTPIRRVMAPTRSGPRSGGIATG